MNVKRSLYTLVLCLSITLAGLSTAAPAQAAKLAVSMTFNASPEPVSKGSTISLLGRAWNGSTGNGAFVSFYFKKLGAATFTYVGKSTASSAGHFGKKVTAVTSGTWQALYWGNSGRAQGVRTDYVQVVQMQLVTRFREASSGVKQTTTFAISSGVRLNITWTATCETAGNWFEVKYTGSTGQFVHMRWTVDSSWTYFRGVNHLIPNSSAGSLYIDAPADCAYVLKAKQNVNVKV
jgi:hypothetical protein